MSQKALALAADDHHSQRGTQTRSVVLALIGGLFFAAANGIVSMFSSKYGDLTFSTFWLSSGLLWLAYHAFHIRRGTPTYKGSQIYRDADGNLSLLRLTMPVVRALFSLGSNWLLVACYKFYSLSGSHLNSGIITSLFATSIVYSGILFYFFYGQKLKPLQVFGMACIVASVAMVSIGTKSLVVTAAEESLLDVKQSLLNWSIGLALGKGLWLSWQLLVIKTILVKF